VIQLSVLEKSVIRTEVIFSECRNHRILLRKEWNKTKKKAMVIMINPSSADEVLIDHTTMYVVNNLSKIGFGSVDIVNIFSKVDTKISTKDGVEGLVDDENDIQISNSAAKVDNIIIAWGKAGESNNKIYNRQKEVIEILKPHIEKIYVIEDEQGNTGFHPLAPQIRKNWKLKRLIDLKTELRKQNN